MAFSSLPHLEDLTMSDNRIGEGTINPHAFLWMNESSKIMKLDLSGNPITEAYLRNLIKYFKDLGIKGGAESLLTEFKRPVELILDNTPLEYLPETIFKPFLRQNPQNSISIVSEGPRYFDCFHCRNFWLYEQEKGSDDTGSNGTKRFKYRSQIKAEIDEKDVGICKDTIESFWGLDLDKFQYCFHK